MTTHIKLDTPYRPAMAEDAKFCEIDKDYLSTEFGYPTSAYGKTAIFVKVIDAIEIAGAGSSGAAPWIGSSTLAGAVVFSSAFNPPLKELEIQNKTGAAIYYMPTIETQMGAMSARGIEVLNNGLYTISRIITEFSVGSLSGGDVRMVGYY